MNTMKKELGKRPDNQYTHDITLIAVDAVASVVRKWIRITGAAGKAALYR
jgi:hypothetical protein